MTATITKGKKPKEEPTRGLIRWRFIKKRIAQGLCRDCGAKRGRGGTADRCAACAERRRNYQREHRAKAAIKARAGVLAGALGDTAPRVPAPRATAPTENAIRLDADRRLELEAEPSTEPSPSAEGDRPWATDHWRCVLSVRGVDDKRQETMRLVVTAGPAFEGRPPTLAEVLALLLRDVGDSGMPFPEWCAALGQSTDSLRAHQNYKLVRDHRVGAVSRLLGDSRPALEKRILGRKADG